MLTNKKIFRLLKVRYKNIMSVADEAIELDLSTYHKTLCTGKNGAGKSTMLEAIYFALFGKPFRDISKGLLLNTITKKGLLVDLWLEYNGSEYHITRGIKPNKFAITKDDNPVDAAASVKDFQLYFEDMIGMNSVSFKQIVVLGTAGYTPFMQLKAGDRRKLVEDLLEVTVLAQMDKLNKAKIKELNLALSSQMSNKANLEAQLNIHKQNQQSANQSSEAAVAEHMAKFTEHRQKAVELKATVDARTEELLAIDLTPPSAVADLPKFEAARYKAAAQRDQYAGVAHMHQGGGNCPTCLQNFNDDVLLSKIGDKISTIESQLEKADAKIAELKDTILEFTQRTEAARSIQIDINSIRKDIAYQVDLAKQAKAAADRLSADRPDYSAEINELGAKLLVEVEKTAEIEREKYQRAQLTELLKDSGVKAVVMARYMPYFNSRIGHYLTVMDADYEFTLDAEFSEVIKSAGREDFVYNSFSQGEKARIDMAVLFAWRDLASEVSGVDVNALFMDEVFDGPSDDDAQSAVFAIINDMDANIFIISHGEHDPQKFDRHVKMTKVGRTSKMEETIHVSQSINDYT